MSSACSSRKTGLGMVSKSSTHSSVRGDSSPYLVLIPGMLYGWRDTRSVVTEVRNRDINSTWRASQCSTALASWLDNDDFFYLTPSSCSSVRQAQRTAYASQQPGNIDWEGDNNETKRNRTYEYSEGYFVRSTPVYGICTRTHIRYDMHRKYLVRWYIDTISNAPLVAVECFGGLISILRRRTL